MTTNKGGVNMKYVYRMMSKQEYMDLIAGKTIVNTTVHDPEHSFSYSTGCCFLPWTVECRTGRTRRTKLVTKMTALQAFDRLLVGAGFYDVWVQLKVINPKVLKKSRGEYKDFETYDLVWINELCTTSYNAKDLQPTHAFSVPKLQEILFKRTMGAY